MFKLKLISQSVSMIKRLNYVNQIIYYIWHIFYKLYLFFALI